MKVKVSYTYEIDSDELKALQRYQGRETVKRDDIRQMLIDLGKMGLEEQINQGDTWLQAENEERED